MPTTDSGLMQGEEIIYETRLNRIIFVGPCLLAFILVISGVYSLTQKNVGWAVGLFVIAALAFLNPYIRYRTSHFVVSNRRLLIQVGLLNRRSFEMLLNKVESIAVAQDVFERMLGYGRVAVIGTGGSRESFQSIDAPIEFRREVQTAIETFAGTTPAPASSFSETRNVAIAASASPGRRYCTSCGEGLGDTARFCGQCGTAA